MGCCHSSQTVQGNDSGDSAVDEKEIVTLEHRVAERHGKLQMSHNGQGDMNRKLIPGKSTILRNLKSLLFR